MKTTAQLIREMKELERERCARIVEHEADKLEDTGSPTMAGVLRTIAEKLRRGK